MKMLHEEITDKVIGAFYNVYNKLGYGFLEKVYENALLIELAKTDLKAVSQKRIIVFYDGQIVGNYFADIIVEEKVIVEIKASSQISKQHEAQLLNYLKATKVEVGLLLNFGEKPAFKRKIFENYLK